MTVPAVRPLTTPTFVIVATELLDDVHVPFVEGVTFADDPAQMAEAPPKEGAEGGVLITTSDEGTEVHVFAFVTLKVYVVLEGRPVTVYEAVSYTHLDVYKRQVESRIYRKISNYQNIVNKSNYELSNFGYKINQLINKVNHLFSTIDNLNPEKIIQKGYSIIRNQNGEIISSVRHTKLNDKLILKVRDGNINTKVI